MWGCWASSPGGERAPDESEPTNFRVVQFASRFGSEHDQLQQRSLRGIDEFRRFRNVSRTIPAGTTSCGSGGAQAKANIDSVFNLPQAKAELNSICRLSDGECTRAVGSASFSVDFTATGGGTTQGLIELENAFSVQTGAFSGGFYNVGLPGAGIGPHGVSQYEFTYGTPFTVSGGLSGGCSEWPIGGDGTVLSVLPRRPRTWRVAACRNRIARNHSASDENDLRVLRASSSLRPTVSSPPLLTTRKGISFRPAKAGEMPSIRALLKLYPDQLAQKNLPGISSFLVATAGGKIVGCCALQVYSKRLAEVRSLAVHPDFQKRTIAPHPVGNS